MTSPFTFSFSATAAADTPQAYAVTVFADVNNNGVKDTGELASTTQTVTFSDVTDVVVNYTLDAVIEGGLAVGADVTIAGIALDQLTAAEFGVKYTLGTGAALGAQARQVGHCCVQHPKDKVRVRLDTNWRWTRSRPRL